VGEDARDGVEAAVVVAEHLGEEAPDGGHRVEQPVAEGDAVLVGASRMQDSVKESAKGRPRSRAKRARTSSSVIRGDLKSLRCGAGQEAR
jgi:hypothetical protein